MQNKPCYEGTKLSEVGANTLFHLLPLLTFLRLESGTSIGFSLEEKYVK